MQMKRGFKWDCIIDRGHTVAAVTRVKVTGDGNVGVEESVSRALAKLRMARIREMAATDFADGADGFLDRMTGGESVEF